MSHTMYQEYSGIYDFRMLLPKDPVQSDTYEILRRSLAGRTRHLQRILTISDCDDLVKFRTIVWGWKFSRLATFAYTSRLCVGPG